MTKNKKIDEAPKIETKKGIKITAIPPSKDLAEKIHYNCHFCGKNVGLYPQNRRWCERLSGKEFFCPFCLRNNYHTKNNKHILVMSFRAIFGFYYYDKYYYSSSYSEMYINDIEEYIKSHAQTGMLNPIFNYDPETYLWFIDFSKVGRGKKRIKVKEVLKTILNILVCFDSPQNVANIQTSKLYEIYEEAILKFY